MMKRGLLVIVLMLVLVGCGKTTDTAVSVTDSESMTEDNGAASDNEAVADFADVADNTVERGSAAMSDNGSMTEDNEAMSDSGSLEEDIETEPEGAAESIKKYLKEMKANHNSNPIDLTPRVGEFAVWSDDDMDLIDTPDGEQYGFWQDITPGCSVWCAVMDYKVNAEASSTLAPQGKYNYEVTNLTDGNRSDAWVEGVDGNGIGETISITKSYDTSAGEIVPDEESVFFYEMCIVNGIARNDKVWKENGRVKALKFFFNGEYQGTIELEDTPKPQFISLSGLNLAAANCEDSTFTFEIADVYSGEKYEDTAITGIEIAFDSPNH